MLEIIKAGGWAMAPILACSALMLGIVLERFWTLRRKSVLPDGLLDDVLALLRARRLDAKHLDTLRDNSPLGEVLAAALSVRQRPREVIRERLEDSGRHAVHRMERYLGTLGTIALIAPLLGLLGTVIGLIRMFLAVMVSGVGDPMKMAGGMGEALICTATGLVVAIPAYALHRYFRDRVDGYAIEMEHQATRLLDELNPVSVATAPATAPARPRATARTSAS